MADLLHAFVEIINHYGFKISKQLVAQFEAAGKFKQQNKKPIIGIHFHKKCCVNNGEIVKYVNPQYSLRKNGFNHNCDLVDKSVYINDEFLCNSCPANSDHPKTNACGIFINFQKQSFKEFVVEKYNECFNKQLFHNESENEKKDIETVDH
eukprot:239173_1